MTNERHSVLYTGVTNNLKRRVTEHKAKINEGFSKRYNLSKLVYYEIHNEVYLAIQREKIIKGGSRQKKIDLVNNINSGWVDLYDYI